jgi:hypothetical protein
MPIPERIVALFVANTLSIEGAEKLLTDYYSKGATIELRVRCVRADTLQQLAQSVLIFTSLALGAMIL